MAESDSDEQEGDVVVPRPFWSGTIAFGLVSLPVSLFPANRGRQLSLKMVDADGTPLARRYFSEKTGKPLGPEDIVRGYKVDEDQYVLVDDEELEALAPEKSREIDLRRFVELADIDPMYFERAYFLVPDEGANKAYRLLARSMEDEGRAGIATFVMRGKEYLCAIIAEKGILRVETLRFHDELRTPEDIGLPVPGAPPKSAVKAMQQAIRAHAAKAFKPDELQDEASERLLAYVKKKLKSGKDVIQAPDEVAEELGEESNVVDLMQVLKERLQGRDPARSATKGGENEDGGGASARDRGKHRQKASGRASEAPRRKRGQDDLEALPKSELYERAQKLDIPGRSHMSKDQLIEAITRN